MAEDANLAEYLRRTPWKGGRSCAVCALDPALLAQVHEVVGSGMRRWRGIAAWLKEQGVEDMTPNKLSFHFERGHHEP